MPVLTAPVAPTHELGGNLFHLARDAVQRRCRYRRVAGRDPAGDAATPHSLTREEVFVVLEGTASVRIAGQAGVAGAGDAIVVPAGSSSSWRTARMRRCGRVLPAGRRAGAARRRQHVHAAMGGVTGGMTGRATAGGPPLARLFAIAYRQLIDGLHERLRELGWTDVREAFGFVPLAARDQPTSITESAALMGRHQAGRVQAGRCHGRVRLRQPRRRSARRRQRPVALTSRGRDLLAAVEQMYAELEGAGPRLSGAQVDGSGLIYCGLSG